MNAPQPLLDRYGRPMFICRACGEPMTSDDLFRLGLRLPDYGETREEYCDAELIDEVEHESCGRRARAG